MIIQLYGDQLEGHRDENKVQEFLCKLHEDVVKYVVDVYYSPIEGSNDYTTVGYLFKDDGVNYTYLSKTFRD